MYYCERKQKVKTWGAGNEATNTPFIPFLGIFMYSNEIVQCTDKTEIIYFVRKLYGKIGFGELANEMATTCLKIMDVHYKPAIERSIHSNYQKSI